jgi:hypothetical protein
MTLADQMAADLANVFLSTSEFAISSTFLPGTDTTGFTLTVVPGDEQPAMIQIMEGQEVSRTARFLAKLSTVRAGIATRLGTARDPIRADRIVIASGADAGTWLVQTVTPDLGDGVQMDCRWSDRRALGGQNAQAVR